MERSDDHEGDLDSEEDCDDDDEHEGGAVGVTLSLVLLARWLPAAMKDIWFKKRIHKNNEREHKRNQKSSTKN